ncbi:conserved hypothetical protein [Vibrio phage 424E50-1]|nr:conserved hypothetical protein [Vibrio phage 424E50-1]
MKNVLGYFVDVNSTTHTIWVDENGQLTSTFGENFRVEGDTVTEWVSDCGEELDREYYTLWTSLVDLAIEIECVNVQYESEGTTLQDAVNEVHVQARDFKKVWLENHTKEPEYYPLSLPTDDAGTWFEQIQEHTVEK